MSYITFKEKNVFEPLDEVTKKVALQGGKNFAVHYLPIGGDPSRDAKVIITAFEPDIQSDTNVYVQLDEEGASIQILNCSCLIEVLKGEE